jgi:hypothetical protein
VRPKQFQGIGRMTAETRYCVQTGGVALASARWRISGAARICIRNGLSVGGSPLAGRP